MFGLKYQDEILFAYRGKGAPKISFCIGIFLISLSYDLFAAPGGKEAPMFIVFLVIGLITAVPCTYKELRRWTKAKQDAAAFKAENRRTQGKIVGYEGGISLDRCYYVHSEPNDFACMRRFDWTMYVEFYNEFYGKVVRYAISDLNKSPKRYVGRNITLYYDERLVRADL